MDANLMLSRYFDGKALEMISLHGKMVAELSARIAIYAGLDTAEICFVEEAAMLHDVGVCRVCAPEIGLTARIPISGTVCWGAKYWNRRGCRGMRWFAKGISA